MTFDPKKTEVWAKIQKLDLSSVREKFKADKGVFWRMRKSADTVEAEYRQFLYLIATNEGKVVVPWTQDLDDFWHRHILDTAKYQADCEAVFGRIVHHNPHLAVGSSQQAKAFLETKQMYRDAFRDKADQKKKTGSADSTSAGCGTFMPVVFCGTVATPSSYSSSSSGCSSSSSSSSSSGSSCGSSSGGGSSCGGGGCGGGGCGGS